MDYLLSRLVFFLFIQNSYLMIIIYCINILNAYYGNDTKIYSAPKYFYNTSIHILGFPCGSVGKELTYNAGDLGSIPGLGEGNGYPLQHSVLENLMDCIVHGVAKSQTGLRDFHIIIHSFLAVLPQICSKTFPFFSVSYSLILIPHIYWEIKVI